MKYKLYSIIYILIFFNIIGCTPVKIITPAMEIKTNPEEIRVKDSVLAGILNKYPQYFDSLLKNNNKFRIQIIYSQIDRNNKNEPQFTHHYYNYDPGQYFYPASTVKMPVAVLALQKLNELNKTGLDKNTTMITEAAFPWQTPVYNDPTAEDGRPTIAHYIKKIFLVSDNDAFNRLYEFLGQEYINSALRSKGYDSVQIVHRLQVNMTEDQHRKTNPVTFYDSSSNIIYQQPRVHSNFQYKTTPFLLGKGYYSGGKLVNGPFDFTSKNRITLSDLHTIFQSILFPFSVPEKKRFNLTDDDYKILYKYMSMKPGESKFPQYNLSDAYVKFLLYGADGQMEPGIRIFNKVGNAYGFLSDVSYIVDFEKGVEFMLSAIIYVNSNGIFNDDTYDYDSVGYPFMKRLGEVIYQHELKRAKNRVPDLSKFKIDYSN